MIEVMIIIEAVIQIEVGTVEIETVTETVVNKRYLVRKKLHILGLFLV
jgi:hypothetical protein